MTLQIVFIVISFLTLLTAWIVVTNRNLFHAALALMGSFLGVAGLYVMLDAGFLAAAQLLVYIGAISILLIFAIMMTRRLMQTTETAFNSQWLLGGITSLVLFAVISFVVLQVWTLQPGAGPGSMGSAPEVSEAVLRDSVNQLGIALVSVDQYVLPFEVASVLLLAAMIGAIVVAWPERRE
jgi:NADH-quinone oxidoreductase subunit J